MLHQLLVPVLGDLDAVHLGIGGADVVALGVCFTNQRLAVRRNHGVQDVEEVDAVHILAFSRDGWKVAHDFRDLPHLRHDVFHRELVIPGHVDPVYFGDGKQVLLLVENLLEKVLGEEIARRYVQLDWSQCRVREKATYACS